MKSEVFMHVLQSAVKRWSLDPEQTHVLIRWYHSDDYHALFEVDSDSKNDDVYLICTQKRVNCIGSGEKAEPATFFICEDAVRKNQAVHDTMKLSFLLDSQWMNDFSNVKVLIATDNLPKNIIADINPFRTTLVAGVDEAKVLVITIDARDSGEYVNDDEFSGPESLERSPSFDFDQSLPVIASPQSTSENVSKMIQ